MDEEYADELLRWIISVDRRMILMDHLREHKIVNASDIAHVTKRSTQNISRALKELEDKGLIRCLTPEKTTWKRYSLTKDGKELMERWEKNISNLF